MVRPPPPLNNNSFFFSRAYKTSYNRFIISIYINKNISIRPFLLVNIILFSIIYVLRRDQFWYRHARRPKGHAHGHAQQHGLS